MMTWLIILEPRQNRVSHEVKKRFLLLKQLRAYLIRTRVYTCCRALHRQDAHQRRVGEQQVSVLHLLYASPIFVGTAGDGVSATMLRLHQIPHVTVAIWYAGSGLHRWPRKTLSTSPASRISKAQTTCGLVALTPVCRSVRL